MADELKVVASRRFFAQSAGAIALAALGGAAAAEERRAVGAMSGRAASVKRAELAVLSNRLYNSPAERSAFLANPQGYAGKLGLKAVNGSDLGSVHQMVADGFCCGGCGCSSSIKDQVTLPALQR